MFCSRLILLGFFCLLLIVNVFSKSTALASGQAPIIAVASNMRLTIEKIGQSFQKETGLSVRFSFGSSGNLTRQIFQGAPFEMFLSADEDYVFRLAEAGKTIDRGKIYAYGRIVAFTPTNSPLKTADFPHGYQSIFGTNLSNRYAIANPELAPYGRAAKQALIHTGLWETMKPYLIFGENISQTAQFSLSGSALGGIIAYSQALTPQFAASGRYKLIPTEFHQPLGQRMALVNGASATTMEFYKYLEREPALEIFRSNGYALDRVGAQH